MKKLNFNLLEMLMITAVIAVLASLFIPVFNNAREHALRADCASGLSSIGKSFTQYYSKNNGKMPTYDWMAGEYMREVYVCPKDYSPKSMDFYMEKENIWQTAQTSFGFNFTSVGNNVATSDVSNLIMSFDSNDLYGLWSAPKIKSNKGGGNNDDGVDSDNPHHGDGSVDTDENGGGSKWQNDVGGLNVANLDNWYYENLNYRHLGIANHLLLDGSVIGVRHRVDRNQLLWDADDYQDVTNRNGNGNGNGNRR